MDSLPNTLIIESTPHTVTAPMPETLECMDQITVVKGINGRACYVKLAGVAAELAALTSVLVQRLYCCLSFLS